PSAIAQAVARAGYSVRMAGGSDPGDARKRETRLALWRWLVAGFCMMQVMMYAYPAYVAAPGDITADQTQLLRWASWVLTLPVIAFSSGPFFRTAWRDAAQGRIGMDTPVALAILVTFAVSTVATFSPNGLFGAEVYFDSLAMFVFFFLTGRWLELRLRDRTAGSLDALMRRLPAVVARRSAGQDAEQFEQVAVQQLHLGDAVRVLPGEAFAADGLLLSGETHVDEALLTGESRPVRRHAGQPVVAGSYNLSAPVVMQVTRLGGQTRYAQIVALMEDAAAAKPRMAALADRLARPFLAAVMLAALAVVALGWQADPQHALMLGVAVLIVTCPCALSLATPTAMLAASGALARAGILVRNMQGLEALAKVDTVVFDKTGTLTEGTPRVSRIATRGGVSSAEALQMAAALAAQSLHPASRAIVAAAQAAPERGSHWVASQVRERAGQGVEGFLSTAGVQGGPATAGKVKLGSAAFCGLAEGGREPFAVQLCDESGWLAGIDMQEALRPDASDTVRRLHRLGIDVQLLSGDGHEAVARVSQALDLGVARAMCSPEDKYHALQALRAAGRHILMVGDGLNDGPALAVAHVSAAMGQGVPVAQARADFIVQGGKLAGLGAAIALSRKTLRVVHQNLAWAALYNLACVPLAVAGALPAWLAGAGMAVSSMVVVANALRLSRTLD
ncbi:MAG: heavy metal translocating P-type ATPase, partial [Rhodoferax sp.]